MDIEEVLLKCNVMRENEEGIGLSDALLRIVEFAYYAGYNQNPIDKAFEVSRGKADMLKKLVEKFPRDIERVLEYRKSMADLATGVDIGEAQPNMTFGESGRGKSGILKPLAEEHALPYFDCRLSEEDERFEGMTCPQVFDALNEENEGSTNRREFPTNSEK